jgi:hypothetical protein
MTIPRQDHIADDVPAAVLRGGSGARYGERIDNLPK